MPCFDNVMPGPGALHLNYGKLVLQGGIENANAGVSAAALLYEMRQYASNTGAHASFGRWPEAAAGSGSEPSNTTWQGLAFDAAETAERLRLFDLNAPAPSADEPGEWGGATSHDGRPRARYMPFVSRLLVRRDTTVVMFGDLHGSLHSLLRILSGLRERGMLSEDLSIAPAFRGGKLVIAFLGDFVDRGAYGAEVMATLLRLHRANAGPGRSGGTSDGGGGLGSIWLLRGNHEDPRMNVHGSFRGELLRKYGGKDSGAAAELAGLDGAMLAAAASWDVPRGSPGTAADQLLGAVGRLYEMLPVALFLGVQGADTLAASLGTHAEQEDGTPPVYGACSRKALEKGWCGDASAAHGAYVMGCHGGIELGFNARPLLLHPSERSHEAAPGLRSLFWPITGLFRAQWLAERAGWTRPHIPEGHLSDAASAQAAPVAAWGASPAALGPLSYPTPPSAVHPGLGFLWSDFFVDDEERVMGWTPGRGPVFGKALTRHWLEDSGVAAVVRAHQHHDSPISGDCLSKMRRNGGWAPHWGGDGSVTTFVSASGIPGLGLAHDGVGVLSLSGLRPAEWSLAHCSSKVGDQVATLQDGRRIGGEESSAAAMDDAGIRPAITHACDPAYRLECEPLPWVGHKAEFRPGKGEPLPAPLSGETGLPLRAQQGEPLEAAPGPVSDAERTADGAFPDAGAEAAPTGQAADAAAPGKPAGWEAVGSMQCKPLRFGEDGVAAVRFRAVVSRGDTAAAVVLEHSGRTSRASLAMPALPAPKSAPAAGSAASAGGSKPWAAVVAARAVGQHRWLAWEASVFATTDESRAA
ncbi:hypothetical protein FNF27_02806 [Cafeteria roenbergensis]|uniref:Serine/threonine specific protein phosphatases domain-containing protein n=1 Tax=Cafeteria roenbergensis TaxID=33653 RepID=A0A5A8EII3_CAFRO|nr:hypothetical protein FNF27_02806 [Cafeteria roenbergensis]